MLKSWQKLYQQLGYAFKDGAWLELALTHRSYSEKHNERLEFLGDSLLNFCIAEKLFHQYPYYDEGELSRLRANLVNGEVLATLAKELAISEYIQVGSGELKSGGRQRKSTLANTMEAIIGAIYLDGGMEICRQRVAAWFADTCIKATLQGIQKDPKTQLQEYLQAQKLALPTYAVLSIQGQEHSQLFTIECSVVGLAHTVKGTGGSRKGAEQDAAANLLALLNQVTK